MFFNPEDLALDNYLYDYRFCHLSFPFVKKRRVNFIALKSCINNYSYELHKADTDNFFRVSQEGSEWTMVCMKERRLVRLMWSLQRTKE